jgi:hypothetical protein
MKVETLQLLSTVALEPIEQHRAVLPRTWVVGDDEFGRSTLFRRSLRDTGERYLLAVPSNTLVRDLATEPPAYRGFGSAPWLHSSALTSGVRDCRPRPGRIEVPATSWQNSFTGKSANVWRPYIYTLAGPLN